MRLVINGAGSESERQVVMMETKKKYGTASNGQTYLFNAASHPLHPWSRHHFTWAGLRFERLEQCLGIFKATHFKLSRLAKVQILGAETGWEVVKILKQQNIPTNADWSGWGKWLVSNLLSILRQMAMESPRFRRALLEIREPVIALCTKDKSLGIGADSLPTTEAPELFDRNTWTGRSILGEKLMELRGELLILDNFSSDED